MPVVRDASGIIVQVDIYNPLTVPKDGGDSAARTGIMAAFGNQKDIEALRKNWKASNRHPWQEQWKDVRKQSRDQQVCLMAGAHAVSPEFARSINNFPGLTINNDVLAPDVVLHMRKATGEDRWYHYIFGVPFLYLSILWASYVQPTHELNQLACQALVAGPKYLRLLKKLHPNYNDNFKAYFDGWRDQQEISAFVIQRTEEIIK